jgi:hypothetical protein
VPLSHRDLAVGRLDDLGGFPDCPVPDSRVGVGEGPFGGVEPGGDRGPPLDGDGGAPALVEVADGEDAVLTSRNAPLAGFRLAVAPSFWPHTGAPRCGRRRMLSHGTVLAVPQFRVSARWISCSRAASIEM